jgi:hypothetical protein
LTASLDAWTAALARLLSSFKLSAASCPKTAPDLGAKTSTTELAADLKSKNQEPATNPGKATASRCCPIALESFGAMEQSNSLYFADELPHRSEPSAVTPPDSNRVATRVGSGQQAASSASKACAPAEASVAAHCGTAASVSAVVDDVYEEIAGSLWPVQDGVTRPVAKAIMARQALVVMTNTRAVAGKSQEVDRIGPQSVIKPRFEPLEVGENRCSDITHSNNHGDGNNATTVPIAASVPIVPTVRTREAELAPTRPAPDLSRAVKLTREAVYAWVNVLAGPAIVTVSQPN